MTTDTQFSAPARSLIGFAAFVIVAAGMRAASEIIVPVLLAAFIAIIFAPQLVWLRAKGVPAWAAMPVVAGILFLLGFVFVMLVGNSIAAFTDDLPKYQEGLQTQLGGAIAWFESHHVNLNSESIREQLSPSTAMGFVSTMIASLGGLLANGFLIVLIVIFMLAEASSFPVKFAAAMGKGEASTERLVRVTHEINRYMALKTLTSFITAVLTWLLLRLMGIDYALLWGVLAFLLNYVPNIGSIVSSVPPILLAVVQYGFDRAIWATIGLIAVNVAIGNVLEPKMMGRGLGLSALVVFLSLIFWGWVLGPVGMLLSVPLTMAFKIALEANAETRWISGLLGDEASARSAARSKLVDANGAKIT